MEAWFGDDGWTDGLVGGGGLMEAWLEDGRTDGRTDGQTDGRMDGWLGWMDGWMDGEGGGESCWRPVHRGAWRGACGGRKAQVHGNRGFMSPQAATVGHRCLDVWMTLGRTGAASRSPADLPS
eukprot:202726-Chlamydomonas_euryale.AAC.10